MSTEDDIALTSLSTHTAVRADARSAVRLSVVAEAMLRVSPDPVFVVDRAGRYLYVGDAGARAMGLPASEIVGRAAHEFGLTPEVAADLASQTERVFLSKQPHTGTAIVPTVSGLRLYEHHFTPLFDDDGEVTAMLCMARDVTERQAEATAQEHEQRIRPTLQAAQMGTFEANLATHAAYLPEETKVLLGFPPDALLSTREQSYTYIHPEDRPLLLNAIEQSRQTGEPYLVEFRVLLPEGGVRWLAARGQVELADNGQRQRLVGVLWDINWRKEAELALRQKEAEIIALNRDLQRQLQEVEAIVRTVPIAVNIAEDVACTRIRGNPAAYRMLRTPDDANVSATGPEREALPFRVCRDGQEIPGDTLPMQVAARTGQQVSNVEIDIVFEDGVTYHWFGGAAPLFDEQGATRGSVGAFVDITERKQAEEQLRQSEEGFRILAEAMPQFVWMSDAEGNVEYVNRRWTEYTGQTVKQTGPHGDEVIHPEDAPIMWERWQEARMTGEDYEVEFRCRRASDGAYRWFLARGVPVTNRQGQIVRWIGTSTDIEALKEAQAQIGTLNTSLHRAVYESSHRIKNQLQVLTATADMVLMDGQEAIAADEFRRLRSQIEAIATTHDLLTREARVDGTTDRISLDALLERTLTVVQRTTDRHALRYTLDKVAVPLKTATSVALIVNEAVSNAIKHGGGVVEVTVVVADGQARLEVCDDGPGFPDGFDARQAANTGLDLLMTLTRIDLGGIVEFTDRAEGGARVVVDFPLPAAP